MHLLRFLATASTAQSATLTPEELHALLADTRRRHTIVDVDELVQDVATRTGTDAESMQPAIRHAHLPQLEAAGIIAWSTREDGAVEVATKILPLAA